MGVWWWLLLAGSLFIPTLVVAACISYVNHAEDLNDYEEDEPW